MSTTTGYSLRFTNGGEPTDDEREEIGDAYTAWMEACDSSSNDEEGLAAAELIDKLMNFASIEVDQEEFEVCDECDQLAEVFWPKLAEPVQLCSSCEHNARRSGWEPGQ